uniref:Uncharacterized protein n=1 Tax=Angiostrongylus cantonensis TaxID=6313 RepID=A0A0K0DRM4_ANGCA
MSDDEVRLLIGDLQDGTGLLDNALQANALVVVKSIQSASESTFINKLSTPFTGFRLLHRPRAFGCFYTPTFVSDFGFNIFPNQLVGRPSEGFDAENTPLSDPRRGEDLDKPLQG